MATDTGTAVHQACTKCGEPIVGDIYNIGGGHFHIWCVPKQDVWPLPTELVKQEAWREGYQRGYADGQRRHADAMQDRAEAAEAALAAAEARTREECAGIADAVAEMDMHGSRFSSFPEVAQYIAAAIRARNP